MGTTKKAYYDKKMSFRASIIKPPSAFDRGRQLMTVGVMLIEHVNARYIP